MDLIFGMMAPYLLVRCLRKGRKDKEFGFENCILESMLVIYS